MNSMWIEVPGYPDYKVSPEGNILSLKRSPKILSIDNISKNNRYKRRTK